jgi:hypothetical protein
VIIDAAKQGIQKIYPNTSLPNESAAVPTSNRFQALSETNHNQQVPQKSSVHNSPALIDNLLIHDSTGKNLIMQKLYPRDKASCRERAGYFQDALDIIESGPVVNHSIIIRCGIRDARQLADGWNSRSKNQLLSAIVRSSQYRSPQAKLVLVSLPPSEDTKLDEHINMINNSMQAHAQKNQGKVVYCDIHSWLSQDMSILNGPHVKLQFTWKIAVQLKTSLGINRKIPVNNVRAPSTRDSGNNRTGSPITQRDKRTNATNKTYSQVVQQSASSSQIMSANNESSQVSSSDTSSANPNNVDVSPPGTTSNNNSDSLTNTVPVPNYAMCNPTATVHGLNNWTPFMPTQGYRNTQNMWPLYLNYPNAPIPWHQFPQQGVAY